MRLVFLGSKRLGLLAAERLHTLAGDALMAVVTVDDRDDVRSQHAALLEFGSRTGVPVHVPDGRQASETCLRELAPDCVFVVGWYWLLSPELLRSVPYGFIGVHNSLLPQYRGFSPLVWAMINGEKEAGYSIFSLTEGVDDGPLWAQERIPLGPTDYVGDVLARLEHAAVDRIGHVYEGIAGGTLVPRPQSEAGATYCARRGPGDGRIDWTQPAHRIHDFVRALSDPYPGAFTVLAGEKLTIWRADLFGPPFYGAPGQVTRLAADGSAVVTTGDGGALVLREVERSGHRGPANLFVRSLRIRFPSVAE